MSYSVEDFSSLVESGLRDIKYPAKAPKLFDPVRYTLDSGGKRLRPVLTLSVFKALSGREPQEALRQAMAVEVFHNFTLLHDDVMDNADIRRGRPTVHRKWDSNAAILSGDAMLTLATQLLAECPADRLGALLKMFNDTAMEVYEGQQLDMEFETRMDVTVREYLEMIRLKTSVLLACACSLGAIMAGASAEDCRRFYEYGEALGIAFQLQDDWLDTYGDPAVFGKEIGGDILNRKKTWLLITAMEEAPDELPAILSEDLEPAELISQVRGVYDRLELSARCAGLAAEYSERAAKALAKVEMDAEAREFFTSLARKAAVRTY